MAVPKSYVTVLTNLFLALASSVIAYFTGWILIIPILFGLGIPLVNHQGPIKQKVMLTLVIMFISTVTFLLAIVTAISFNMDKYIFPSIVVGVAGILFYGINALLIDSVKLTYKSLALTFVLAGISIPLWIYLTENIFPSDLKHSYIIRQHGVMLFWMILTTLGISTGIKII